jgi:hypothetical protein
VFVYGKRNRKLKEMIEDGWKDSKARHIPVMMVDLGFPQG